MSKPMTPHKHFRQGFRKLLWFFVIPMILLIAIAIMLVPDTLVGQVVRVIRGDFLLIGSSADPILEMIASELKFRGALSSNQLDFLDAEADSKESWVADTANYADATIAYHTGTYKNEGARGLEMRNDFTTGGSKFTQATSPKAAHLGVVDDGKYIRLFMAGGYYPYHPLPSPSEVRFRFYEGADFFEYDIGSFFTSPYVSAFSCAYAYYGPCSRQAAVPRRVFTATGTPDWTKIDKTAVRIRQYHYGGFGDIGTVVDSGRQAGINDTKQAFEVRGSAFVGGTGILNNLKLAGLAKTGNILYVGPEPYGEFPDLTAALKAAPNGTQQKWTTIYVLPGEYIYGNSNTFQKTLIQPFEMENKEFIRIEGVNRPQFILDHETAHVFRFFDCNKTPGTSFCGPFEMRGLDFMRGPNVLSTERTTIAAMDFGVSADIDIRGWVLEDLRVYNTRWEFVNHGTVSSVQADFIVKNVTWYWDPLLDGNVNAAGSFGPMFTPKGVDNSVAEHNRVIYQGNTFIIDDHRTSAADCAKTHMVDFGRATQLAPSKETDYYFLDNYFEMNCCEDTNDCEFHEITAQSVADSCVNSVSWVGNQYVLKMNQTWQADPDFHFFHEHAGGASVGTEPCTKWIIQDNSFKMESSTAVTPGGEIVSLNEAVSATITGNTVRVDMPLNTNPGWVFARGSDPESEVHMANNIVEFFKPDGVSVDRVISSFTGRAYFMDCQNRIDMVINPTEAVATTDNISLIVMNPTTGFSDTSTTIGNVDQYQAVDGDIWLHDIQARVDVAPGVGNGQWDIGFTDDGVLDTVIQCSIDETNTTCNTFEDSARFSAGGSNIALQVASSGAPDPAAAAELHLSICVTLQEMR